MARLSVLSRQYRRAAANVARRAVFATWSGRKHHNATLVTMRLWCYCFASMDHVTPFHWVQGVWWSSVYAYICSNHRSLCKVYTLNFRVMTPAVCNGMARIVPYLWQSYLGVLSAWGRRLFTLGVAVFWKGRSRQQITCFSCALVSLPFYFSGYSVMPLTVFE